MSKMPSAPKPIKTESELALKPTQMLMPDQQKGRKVSREFPEAFDGLKPPQQLWASRRHGTKVVSLPNRKPVKGVLHVCGRGSMQTDGVLFISPCVLREEEMTTYSSEPAMLNGPAGNLLIRMLSRCGFKDEDWHYTALCKYTVPGLKPTAQDIRWNALILDDEIRVLKPRIIVCLGKIPFDHLFKLKFKLKDIQGGFFRSEQYGCLLYPMDTILTPILKPEYQERFFIDLTEMKKKLDELRGSPVVKVTTNYSTIATAEQLTNLMAEIKDDVDHDRVHMSAIDCEWHGRTAWSGMLRSFQLSWKLGVAAYIRLCAPVNRVPTYVMDQPLPVVREIIAPCMNHPKLKFIGHNLHADMAWMDEHLEIDVFHRAAFDTMFAQQLLNEYADLKLERCAVQYTDLGRYDLDLLLWKKKTKFDEEDNVGYGKVPDDIIVPYGLSDVDATFRMFPILMKKLLQERLSTYYFRYTLPFVTDGFYELMSTGIPMDRGYLDEMRETYSGHGRILLDEFRKAVKKEADTLLLAALRQRAAELGDPDKATPAFMRMCKLHKLGAASETELRTILQSFATDGEEFAELVPIYMHWRECDQFNISSTEHLRRWLFDVKKFTPIKTTKKDGIQMAWDKVLRFPPEKQAQFTPAADKQSVKVFAAKDAMVAQLEELKSVQNITKIFLQEEKDGKEQGLHKWIQPDERVHSNFALTETGRPRAWQPNILNWPKAITKPIESAFERINIRTLKTESEKAGSVVTDKQVKALKALADGTTKPKDRDEAMKSLLDAGHKADAIDAFTRLISLPVSIRSGAKAPEGHVLIDMDLKTAEVVALGRLSGDQNLIKVVTEPDAQFARIDKDAPKKAVRICYNDNVDLPEDARDPALLVSEDDPRILRDSNGHILHPLRDVHWEMAEETGGKPREQLEERLFRDGMGKVGNFCLLISSRVLTHRGEVAIQDVKLDDLLWDGVEWVAHEGVVCNGEKLTHHYQGLWATDNHEVWIENGNKVLFGDARRNGWNLLRPIDPNSAPETGSGSSQAGCQDGQAQVGLVYDILNVGPRHRFTCSGCLVSNSIPYGAAATLLERMIEANTGIKPPEGTGDKMIEAHARRYPVATEYQQKMEKQIEDPGYFRAISGRVRHFFYNSLGDLEGITDYTKEGILSGLKRQARNFP